MTSVANFEKYTLEPKTWKLSSIQKMSCPTYKADNLFVCFLASPHWAEYSHYSPYSSYTRNHQENVIRFFKGKKKELGRPEVRGGEGEGFWLLGRHDGSSVSHNCFFSLFFFSLFPLSPIFLSFLAPSLSPPSPLSPFTLSPSLLLGHERHELEAIIAQCPAQGPKLVMPVESHLCGCAI